MTITKNPAETLACFAKQLLEPNLGETEEKVIINRLHDLLSKMSDVTGFADNDEWEKDLQAFSGLAISMNEAAKCLLDYRRTAQFLRGLFLAVKEAQLLFPAQTLHVLYAGCGPYAPFFSLIAPLFSPDEIQFTLVEINENSLKAAMKLAKEASLEAYLDGWYLEDATLFKIPDGKKFHILFTETMDAALWREPIVSILLNLIPQMRKDALVVPQNVVLEAMLFKEKDLPEGPDTLENPAAILRGRPLGVIMDLKAAIHAYLERSGAKEADFYTFRRSMRGLSSYQYFVLFTRVEIWKDVHLNRNESDITVPRIKELTGLPIVSAVEFSYALEKVPELKYFTLPKKSPHAGRGFLKKVE